MEKVDLIRQYLEEKKRLEMHEYVELGQISYYKAMGAKPNKAYRFMGWYPLPENLAELETRVRGKFLYVVDENGDKLRYTLEYE